MNLFPDCHLPNLSNSIINLHCSPVIQNSFGYVDDNTLINRMNSTTGITTNMLYGYFECFPIDDPTKHISLQIYSRRQNSPNQLLHLNSSFANLNGFKNGDKVLFTPINKIFQCKSVELIPMEIADWEFVVQNSTEIEEIFLSQIRVIRPGMSIVIFSSLNGIVSPIKFFINVIHSSANDQQNFLLDRNTHVIVSPRDCVLKSNKICSKNSPSPLELFKHDLEFEENIATFILPNEKSGYFRVLPSSMKFCPKFDAKNPFFNIEGENFAFFNAFPFVFIAGTKMMIEEENDEIIGWNWLKKYLVEIVAEGNKSAGAILCQIPMGENLVPLSTPLETFLCNLAEIFKKADCFGLSHCWISNGFRRIFKGIQDLQWLKIQPFPLERIEKTNSILFKSSQNAQYNLSKILSISRRLKCPWLFPSNGYKMEMAIGEEKICAELMAKHTTMNENYSHFFCWPLSAKLDIEIEKCAENNGNLVKLAEKQVEMMDALKLNLFEISAQLEIVDKMHIFICSTIKYSLICQQNHWPSIRHAQHLLLNGLIGSGKTIILKCLSEKLRTICAEGALLIENELVDCAGKTLNELLKLIKESLTRLNLRWPSALLLDNFDCFAEKILHSDEDEEIGRIRTRKIYQSIFSIIANFARIPIVCSANCWRKISEEEEEWLLFWEGRPFFDELQEIGEFSQVEQKSILEGAFGHMIELKKVQNQLKFPMIGDLVKIIDGAKLFEQNVFYGQNVKKLILQMNKISQNIGFGEEALIEFDKIAGLKEGKQKLTEIFIFPSKYPKLFASARLNKRAILYGPSGNGKTLLLRALANEMRMNVLSVKGPELYSKYIGESEQKVRNLFSKARSSKPTLIVFDEFDALAPQRGSDDAHVTDRLVNQLLTELDGFEGGDTEDEDLFIIAATNRLDIVDKALLRPGRFEHKISVEKPNYDERLAILHLYTKMVDKIPLYNNVNLGLIAECTEGFSGAEMRAIVQNAFWFSERRGDNEIRQKDFQMASKRDAKIINRKEMGKMNEKKRKKLALN